MAYISKITPLGSSTTYDLKASLLINTHVTSEAAAIPATKGLFGVYTTTSDSSGLSNDGHILSGTWHNNDSNFGYQLFIDTDPTYKMALRQRNSSGVWQAWKLIPMADGTNASGTWGISITGNAATATSTYNLLNYSGNECSVGSSSTATNTDLWINYRSGYGGSTSDSATQLKTYHFGNRKGSTTGVVIDSNRFLGASTSSSWLDGQRYAYAPYNIGDITNTNGYWPWMRATSTAASKWFSFGVLGTKYYWLGSSTSRTENSYDYGMSFDIANGYLQGCSRVYGAVWNDYAEYRITKDKIEPGRCVIETGKDDLVLSTERLQPGAEIVSDTFGFAIGETDKAKTPIATTGRVLAYIYEGREAARAAIGKPVCSGPDGTVSIMTDEEYQKYGYCAIGTISAVPDYEEWGTGNIKVNNRIWIRIR